MTPHVQSRLETALRTADAVAALRMLVNDLAADGLDKQSIYDLYSEFFVDLDRAGRDDDAQRVADVLDAFAGWCAPEMRVLPGEPDILPRVLRQRSN